MSKGLRIEGLVAGYRRHEVLHGVDLEAPTGQVTALLGTNGCGKSTLLSAVCGLLRPAAGRVTQDGVDLLRLRPAVRARRIAYVPQLEHGADGGLNVFDTVALGLPRRIPRAERFARTAAVLERMGLAEHALRRTGTMSGGERQRVVIGRAVVAGTPFLCLDEPTSNLDVHHQVEVMALLRALADEGKGILVVLHDVTAAAAVADQVVLLDQGRVVAMGTPGQVLSAEWLEGVYGTPFDVYTRRGRIVALPVHRSSQHGGRMNG